MAASPPPDRHALVIGIDAYAGGIPPLDSARKDAEAVAAVLADAHGYAVTSLLDGEATRDAVTGFLTKTIPSHLTAETPFLVYFAGHGVAEGSDGSKGPQGYLILQDAELGNQDTWLSMDLFRGAIDALDCRHLLVVLDCCYAGAFRWATATRDIGLVGRQTLYESVYQRFLDGTAWQALTSASATQRAADASTGFPNLRGADDQGHSPFAAALIDGLAGAADTSTVQFPADGVITATELYQYVANCLLPASDQAMVQTPGIWPLKPDNAGEFVFLNPRVKLKIAPDPPLDDDNNPWLGLEAYTADKKDLYFGRQDATAQLVARVTARSRKGSIVAVVGPSGAGKTSLVQAGLLPAIDEPKWKVVQSARLAGDPNDALAEAVKELTGVPKRTKRLLVIDGFEDLYTQCPDPTARARFLEELVALAGESGGPRVVLTLRSDFEVKAAAEGSLAGIWQAARFQVPPLTGDELRQVIAGPAQVKALYYEPATVADTVFDAVSQTPGVLPLLSFALAQLYREAQRRQQGTADRSLSSADYEAIGGVVGALDRRATELYTGATVEEQQAIRLVFLRLVTQEGAGLTAARAERAELQFGDGADAEQQCVDDVIQKYVREGLLVVDASYVEPAHDALVAQWQLLHDWLKASNTQDLIQAAWPAATNWETHDRAPGYLWDNDPRLPQLAAAHAAGELNATERGFETASTRRRTSRRRRLVAIVVTVMAVLAAAALIAWVQRNDAIRQRNQATSLALTAIARTGAASNLDNSLLLNLEAYRASPTLQAEKALITDLEQAPQAILHGGFAPVKGVAFSPDGSTVIAAGADGRIRFWDTATHADPRPPVNSHQGQIRGLAFRPHGRMFATAGDDGTVRIWDAPGVTQPVPKVAALPGIEVDSLAFSRNGRMLAAGYDNGQVRVWDLDRNAPGRVLRGAFMPQKAPSYVVGLAFSPNGALLAGARGDGTVLLWRLGKRSLPERLLGCGGAGCALHRLAFSPDGKALAAGSNHGVVLWNVSNPSRPGSRTTLQGSGSGTVFGVAFSRAGNVFAAGGSNGSDGTVRLWKLQGGVPGGRPRLLVEHEGPVHALAFNKDGTMLASAGAGGLIRLWNVRRPGIDRLVGDRRKFTGVAFEPGQSLLVSAAADGTVQRWSVRAQRSSEDGSHESIVDGLAFSPDGRTLALAGAKPAQVELVTLRGPPPPRATLPGTTGTPFQSVAFSPNGHTVATGSATVGLWDIRDNEATTLPGRQGTVWSVAFSPDGRLLASGGDDGSVWAWYLGGWGVPPDKGWPLSGPRKGDSVDSVAFSPKKNVLAAGFDDGTVRLWNARTGKAAGSLHVASKTPVSALAFSPDGRTLATDGDRGTVELWDVGTGSRLGRPLAAQVGTVNSVAFSPDGLSLAAAGDTGTVVWNGILWENEAELISRVCSLVSGNLTQGQWKTLVAGRIGYRTTCPG
jgi:WD40 repeat protein/energy-coupling factor transporter ATP-binding protein EcfA2